MFLYSATRYSNYSDGKNAFHHSGLDFDHSTFSMSGRMGYETSIIRIHGLE